MIDRALAYAGIKPSKPVSIREDRFLDYLYAPPNSYRAWVMAESAKYNENCQTAERTRDFLKKVLHLDQRVSS